MVKHFLRNLRTLDLEEKILNLGIAISIIGVFLPWIGGQLSIIDDTTQTFWGLGFHTSIIGFGILCISTYALLLTMLPLATGTQLVQKQRKPLVRMYCTSAAVLLTLAALSVLLKITFATTGMEIRFGIYVTLFGSIASTFYAYLSIQSVHRKEVRELFHHPEEEPEEPVIANTVEQAEAKFDSPVSPPAPPKVEDHATIRR